MPKKEPVKQEKPVKEKKRKPVAAAAVIFYDDDTYETKLQGDIDGKRMNFFVNRLLRAFVLRKGKQRRDERTKMLEAKKQQEPAQEQSNG